MEHELALYCRGFNGLFHLGLECATQLAGTMESNTAISFIGKGRIGWRRLLLPQTFRRGPCF